MTYLLRGLVPSCETSCVCVQNSRDLCCVETSNIWRLYSICTTPEGSSSSSTGLHTPCTHARSQTASRTEVRRSFCCVASSHLVQVQNREHHPAPVVSGEKLHPVGAPGQRRDGAFVEASDVKTPELQRKQTAVLKLWRTRGVLQRRTCLPVCSDREAETPAGRL